MRRVLALMLALCAAALSVPSEAWAEAMLEIEETKTHRYNVLVLDVSGSTRFLAGSMSFWSMGLWEENEPFYIADSAVEYVKTAATAFVRDVINASGDNYVAVVTFDESANILSGFTQDYKELADKIDGIHQNVENGCSIDEGLSMAQSLLNGVDDSDAQKTSYW